MRYLFSAPASSLALRSLALAPACAAEGATIIAKARAYVATEAALQEAELDPVCRDARDGGSSDATKQKHVKIDVVFAKPDRQLMRMTFPEGHRDDGPGRYAGVAAMRDPANPKRQRLTILPARKALRRLRAETWENFFSTSAASSRRAARWRTMARSPSTASLAASSTHPRAEHHFCWF